MIVLRIKKIKNVQLRHDFGNTRRYHRWRLAKDNGEKYPKFSLVSDRLD